ncbi:hypothetical protein L916_03791, partial [Phytophthora nicotianae]
ESPPMSVLSKTPPSDSHLLWVSVFTTFPKASPSLPPSTSPLVLAGVASCGAPFLRRLSRLVESSRGWRLVMVWTLSRKVSCSESCAVSWYVSASRSSFLRRTSLRRTRRTSLPWACLLVCSSWFRVLRSSATPACKRTTKCQ